MTASPAISNAAAILILDALLDMLDVGGVGYIQIRTGSPPTRVTDAATGTLLSTNTLSATAFGGAVNISPHARATANAVASAAPVAGGIAGWFRAYRNDGTGIIQGNCGTSGTDMVLANTTITLGVPVVVTSWTETMREY